MSTIAEFDDLNIAHIARLRLEAEQVEASLDNAFTVHWLPHYASALGWIALVVPSEQAEVARAVLLAIPAARKYLVSSTGVVADTREPIELAPEEDPRDDLDWQKALAKENKRRRVSTWMFLFALFHIAILLIILLAWLVSYIIRRGNTPERLLSRPIGSPEMTADLGPEPPTKRIPSTGSYGSNHEQPD